MTRQPRHRRQRLLRQPARATRCSIAGAHRARARHRPDRRASRPASSVVVADIRDAAAVRRAVDGVDVVYHNVAQVPLARDHGAAAQRQRRRHRGAARRLPRGRRRARSCTPRRARCSAIPDAQPGAAEHACPSPAEAYGAAKLAAEWACLRAAADGPRRDDRAPADDPRPRSPRHLRDPVRLDRRRRRPVRARRRLQPLPVRPRRRPRRAVHRRGGRRPGPTIFNAGTDRFGTMREALEHVCAHAGTGARVRSLPAAPGGGGMRADRAARADAVRAVPLADVRPLDVVRHRSRHATRLGWRPRWSNDEMLAESYDWFVANRGLGDAPAHRARRTAAPRRRACSACSRAWRERARPRRAALSRRRSSPSALMAALAYVPALMSSPGRMPADTKLYLYLDPRRLVSDSIWSFDARQFAGWVPHQVIAYLWPSGPWYVGGPGDRAARLGGPPAVDRHDHVRRRHGRGVGRAPPARLRLAAAVTAGLVYQLSPYLVPYISRTSSMLLPWAGLGWVVGLTIGAATRTRWRDAALCALVIATAGSVNATALAMVAPAPVLWLVLAVVERTVTARRASVAARADRRAGDRHVAVVDGDAVDPGPPGRRPARLLRVAGGRQPHRDVDRGVARRSATG